MTLGEKIRYLREVEGSLRGMGRDMTWQEVVRALKLELRQSNLAVLPVANRKRGSGPQLANFPARITFTISATKIVR